MKKLIAVLCVIFPPMLFAQNQPCTEGLDECQFTTKISYEIFNKVGDVVDLTTYEMKVPLTFEQSIAAKYLHMSRFFEGGAETFLLIRAKNGDMVEALKADAAP